jgi:hypothetical protein
MRFSLVDPDEPHRPPVEWWFSGRQDRTPHAFFSILIKIRKRQRRRVALCGYESSCGNGPCPTKGRCEECLQLAKPILKKWREQLRRFQERVRLGKRLSSLVWRVTDRELTALKRKLKKEVA